MTFIAVTYLARVLGVEMFGFVGFAAAVATLFLLVVDAGLDLVAMREIARNRAALEGVLSSVVRLRLGLSVVAAAVMCALAPWLTSSAPGRAIILAYSLTLVSSAVNLKWAFQALEQNGLVAVALVLGQAVYLAGLLSWVRGPADAFDVPLLLALAELSAGALLFARCRWTGARAWVRPPHGLRWRMLREAFPLAGVRIARTVALNFDLLLLGLVGSASAVGIYAAASRIIFLLRELSEAYHLPLFPRLTRMAGQGSEGFVAVGREGLRYAAIIIFPAAVGGCLTAPQLLSVLFGPEYAPASHALCLLLMALVVSMLTGVCRFGLIAYHRQRALFFITASGTLVNVALNVILIPRYSVVGAAWSALASEGLIFGLSWRAMAQSAPLSPWGPVFRPALAAGGLAAILGLLSGAPFPVTCVVAGISYVVLLFVVGALRPREVIAATRAAVTPSQLRP